MKSKLEKIQKHAQDELSAISSSGALEEWHIKYLGRKQGELTEIMKSLKGLSAEEKKKVGPLANQIKNELVGAYEQRKGQLDGGVDIDVSLPPIDPPEGHLHLRITITLKDGKSMTLQEATMANLVRAYINVKTHPVRTKIRLTGSSVEERKNGFAEWQMLED